MNLYNKFGTNKDLERDGIEIEICGATFYVARVGGSNKKYGEILTNLTKPHRRKLDLGILDDDTQREIAIKAFVKGCLRNWKNVKDQNDKDLPFNETNAIKLFNDLPDLYVALEEAAKSHESFIIDEAEDIAKK